MSRTGGSQSKFASTTKVSIHLTFQVQMADDGQFASKLEAMNQQSTNIEHV